MGNFSDFDPGNLTENEDLINVCKLQDLLRDITEKNIQETIDFCLDKQIDLNEITVQLRIFIQIRPTNVNIYADLLFLLLQHFGAKLKPSIFENIPSLIIKLLYLKGCFMLDEIESIRSQKRDIDMYFAPEFQLKKLPRGNNKNFADRSGNIYGNLIVNDYDKYKELILNDYLIDSKEYAVKTDDITKLAKFDIHYLSTTEIEELLSLASLYSSSKCFKMLVDIYDSQNILTNKVIEKVVEGGNDDIINIIESHGIDLTIFLPFAIKYHRHNFINMCLSKGATFNLTQAAASLDIRSILYAIQHNAKEDRTWDDYERSPLHFAAFYGDCVLGEFYIRKGFNINEKDADGRSVLYEAISSKHPAFAHLLLDHKADLSSKTNEGVSIFERASESTSQEIKTMFQSLSYFYS